SATEPVRSSQMLRRRTWFLIVLIAAMLPAASFAQKAGPATWQNDLKPVAPSDCNYDLAAHLLERAGFGGTPEEIESFARLTPSEAVRRLVYFQNIDRKST